MKSGAIYLVGPTAAGKSAVAMALARRLNGEIISVDSMQVYRGLDIGTAKPTPQERREIPHHVIDVANLRESFDAAWFVRLAKLSEQEIQGRGRLPIYCGGTGFYFNAFLQGLGSSPASDPLVRAELEKIPLPQLLEELQLRDPVMFGEIDRKNPRRVIRALEVIRLTGKPFSAQRIAWKPAEANGPLIGLEMDREELNKRIDQRVDAMFAKGLVEETRSILSDLRRNRTASQAIGYQQVIMHFAGVMTLAETIEHVKTVTHHYAKRQMTWFKKQLPVQWLKVEPYESAEQIAAKLIDIHKLV